MPVDMTRYPANWQLLRVEIRDLRASKRCECTGECGIHRPNPNPRRCVEVHHTPARWFRGRVRLTLAHLCTCDPPCANPDHLKAMCQRCHLRVDRWRHARTRRQNELSGRNAKMRARRSLRPPGEPPWPGAPPTRGYPPARTISPPAIPT